MASTAILARVHGTLITGVVAVHSGETIRALAQVRVDKVHTSGTWEQKQEVAFMFMFSLKVRVVDQVTVPTLQVGLTVGAGAGGAVVDLLLTVEPCVPCGALAEVSSIRVVGTASTVGARPIGTRHGTQLAVVAIKTVRASAGVRVFQILSGKKQNKDEDLFAAAPSAGMVERGQLPGCCKSYSCFIPKDHTVLTVQLPPLRQGFPAHSLTWISQLAPVKPGLQEQV